MLEVKVAWFLVLCLVILANCINVLGQNQPRITNNFSPARIPIADLEDLNLTCTGVSYSDPTPTWKKDGKHVSVNTSISIENGQTSTGIPTSTLIWRKVPLEASGMYTCQFAGVGEDTEEIYIMKAETVNVQVSPFSAVNLTCTVFNWQLYEGPQFYKNNTLLDANNNNYEQSDEITTLNRGISQGKVHSFKILNATKYDGGKYTCMVTVRYGKNNGNTEHLRSDFILTVSESSDVTRGGGISWQKMHITGFFIISLLSQALGYLIL
ncbi:hemicentin-2 [Lingula anatina]|uniref:Hemicentin-2 n=1 Tax=Lingula anatina TaxID=7574 RepID=A0A1S3IP25_LINAN|nr:hemicentin-2 [Lingula anatina]|eukprot:XP_013399289.1 hemicentin-2 [Lingula anatina]